MTRKTLEERFWSKVIILADDNQCWLWTAFCQERGYGWFGYNGKSVRAHKIAWILPNYVIPDGMEICHSCDNPRCCNPKHLFLGTHKENMDDRDRKGRNINHKGEKHGNSKLTEKQVYEIRQYYAEGGITQLELAIQYEISLDTTHRIINRKVWKHI